MYCISKHLFHRNDILFVYLCCYFLCVCKWRLFFVWWKSLKLVKGISLTLFSRRLPNFHFPLAFSKSISHISKRCVIAIEFICNTVYCSWHNIIILNYTMKVVLSLLLDYLFIFVAFVFQVKVFLGVKGSSLIFFSCLQTIFTVLVNPFHTLQMRINALEFISNDYGLLFKKWLF